MAQAIINPAIGNLDPSSTLYDLYTRFYDGMTQANGTDTPEFVIDPIYKKNEDGTYKLDENGAKIVDTEAMTEKATEYSTVLLKNSAYMLANAIVSTIAPGQSGGGTAKGFVSRSGDTMQGLLGALYGFQAGDKNTKIFETTIDANDKKWAIVSGNLQVSEDVSIVGKLNLSEEGLYISGNHTIWREDDKTCISDKVIEFIGDTAINGSLIVGDTVIDKDGIKSGNYEYYHSGNSNKGDVSWTMKDSFVNGDLQVNGDSSFVGKVNSKGGFAFSDGIKDFLYSQFVDGNVSNVALNADLFVADDYSIKFNDTSVLRARSNNIISLSAPGAILNLGDSGLDAEDESATTKYIALQTDIKNYSGAYVMVSSEGKGNFPNGFSIGAANALGTVLQTYCTDNNDYGVLFTSNARFGSTSGVLLKGEEGELIATLPFSCSSDGETKSYSTNYSIYSKTSDSVIYNPTNDSTKAGIYLRTDAEHFSFESPIEASKFAVIGSRYKTYLAENSLFFDNEVFLESVNGAVRISANTLFDDNLYSFDSSSASISYSSGFSGKGWAILEDATVGGMHATFDNLTIRKKMRVYELELQKSSVINGSLWISDSCSGDEVIKLD